MDFVHNPSVENFFLDSCFQVEKLDSIDVAFLFHLIFIS